MVTQEDSISSALNELETLYAGFTLAQARKAVANKELFAIVKKSFATIICAQSLLIRAIVKDSLVIVYIQELDLYAACKPAELVKFADAIHSAECKATVFQIIPMNKAASFVFRCRSMEHATRVMTLIPGYATTSPYGDVEITTAVTCENYRKCEEAFDKVYELLLSESRELAYSIQQIKWHSRYPDVWAAVLDTSRDNILKSLKIKGEYVSAAPVVVPIARTVIKDKDPIAGAVEKILQSTSPAAAPLPAASPAAASLPDSPTRPNSKSPAIVPVQQKIKSPTPPITPRIIHNDPSSTILITKMWVSENHPHKAETRDEYYARYVSAHSTSYVQADEFTRMMEFAGYRLHMRNNCSYWNKSRRSANDTSMCGITLIDDAKKNNAGFVYCLSNPVMTGIYKVGITQRRDPKERMSELYNTSLPTPFHIELIIEVSDCFAMERIIHARLDELGCRVNKEREFFRADLEVIRAIFQESACHTGGVVSCPDQK